MCDPSPYLFRLHRTCQGDGCIGASGRRPFGAVVTIDYLVQHLRRRGLVDMAPFPTAVRIIRTNKMDKSKFQSKPIL